MPATEPSRAFRHFEDEASRFQIRPGAALELRFEAKQRMITRAEGFAIREAYLTGRWKLFTPGVLDYFTEGIKRCDERIAAAEAAATSPVKLEGDDDRHRAEICLNLYARTIQQFTQRRLYTVAAVASVAAAVASVAAIFITALSLAR